MVANDQVIPEQVADVALPTAGIFFIELGNKKQEKNYLWLLKTTFVHGMK